MPLAKALGCPSCGISMTSSGKRWKYSVFDVEFFICDKCPESSKVYFRNGELSHITSSNAALEGALSIIAIPKTF